MEKPTPIRLFHFLSFSLLLLASSPAFAQTAAFTYQGRLTEVGNPANGTYDMQFKLFDTASVGTGTQQGGTIANSAVQVASGVFTVTLDFGTSVFNGSPRFIEVGVRTNGSASSYNLLAPRQSVTPTPYAIYSLVAKTAETATTASNIVNGAVVKSLNNLKDNVTLAAGANVTITPSGNTLTIASSGSGTGGSGLWSLASSNAYYNAGNVGIGTTTPQSPLEVKTGTGFRGLTHTDGSIAFGSYIGSSASGASGGWLGTFTGHPLHFFVNNGQPSLTVATNGNVGIGTFSPQSKLHILGGGIRYEDRGRSLDITAGLLTDITAKNTSLVLQSLGGTGNNDVILNPFPNSGPFPNGNVGIGTFSPQSKLHVESVDTVVSTIKSLTDRAVLSLDSTRLGERRIWTLENGLFGTPGLFGIYDNTALQARLVINPAGKVGIGTATPAARLHAETSQGLDIAMYGVATGSGGIGLYGKSAAGAAVHAEGNATQARDKGGIAKAMLFVGKDGNIIRCYNGQASSSSPGCGFFVTVDVGFTSIFNPTADFVDYQINVGFRVTDRFVSVTPQDSGGSRTAVNVAYDDETNPNRITVRMFFVDDQNGVKSNFTVIIY